MKRIAFLVLGLLISVSANSAVRDIGNGGAGVMINGKPILLDLYEMGFTVGFIEKQLAPLDFYMDAAQVVTALSVDEQVILAQKLTEIHNVSPRLALFLAGALSEYIWTVIDVNLNVIPEVSPLNIETVQLANRLGSVVRFQKSYWDLMDSANHVALVLHEVAYAYAPVVLVSGRFQPDFGVVHSDGGVAAENATGLISKQDSIPVRELIGVLFSANNDTTQNAKRRVIRDQWGPLVGFSTMEGDLVTTLQDLKINGQELKRNLPTLCEELLFGENTYSDVVEVSFDRVVEKMLVQSYQTASGRQKSLNAYWLSSRPGKMTLYLKDQDIFTCEEQVKIGLKSK
jgi:hypothetical protein